MTTPWVDGEAVNASKMTTRVEDRLDVLEAAVLSRAVAVMRQTVAQSIPNGAFTSVTFDVEDSDSANGHSTSSNTSRYTFQAAGSYLVVAHFCQGFNNTGARAARLALSGTAVNGSQVSVQAATASVATSIAVARILPGVTAGQYIELQGFQSSGGALNTSVTAEAQSQMCIYQVA